MSVQTICDGCGRIIANDSYDMPRMSGKAQKVQPAGGWSPERAFHFCGFCTDLVWGALKKGE